MLTVEAGYASWVGSAQPPVELAFVDVPLPRPAAAVAVARRHVAPCAAGPADSHSAGMSRQVR